MAADTRHAGLPGRRWPTRLRTFIVAGAAALPLLALAQAQSPCGQIANAYGPFDFRNDRDKVPVVEAYHFTPEVEMLIRGKSGTIGGDIDYTLRAVPNHHRALLAMMRFAERNKTDLAPNARYTVQCYFIRATLFKPDDTTVRMLYATYLNSRQLKTEALEQLAVAKSYAGDNAFTHYNLGLVYMDLGEPKLALEQAQTALALGFPRTDLKERLIAAKQWDEPASAPR